MPFSDTAIRLSSIPTPITRPLAEQRGQTIDVALLWGPIAGYYARKSNEKLIVTPLADESGARMSFRIAFGVRHSDQNWKRELNQLIAQNKNEIEKILAGSGVPLLDEDNRPVTPQK